MIDLDSRVQLGDQFTTKIMSSELTILAPQLVVVLCPVLQLISVRVAGCRPVKCRAVGLALQARRRNGRNDGFVFLDIEGYFVQVDIEDRFGVLRYGRRHGKQLRVDRLHLPQPPEHVSRERYVGQRLLDLAGEILGQMIAQVLGPPLHRACDASDDHADLAEHRYRNVDRDMPYLDGNLADFGALGDAAIESTRLLVVGARYCLAAVTGYRQDHDARYRIAQLLGHMRYRLRGVGSGRTRMQHCHHKGGSQTCG